MDSSWNWGSSYTVYFREDKSRCLLRNTKFLKVSILDKGVSGWMGVKFNLPPNFSRSCSPKYFPQKQSQQLWKGRAWIWSKYEILQSGHNPISVQLETREKGKTLEEEEVAVPGFCDRSKEKLLFLMKPPVLPDESVIQPNLSYLIEAKLPSCIHS